MQIELKVSSLLLVVVVTSSEYTGKLSCSFPKIHFFCYKGLHKMSFYQSIRMLLLNTKRYNTYSVNIWNPWHLKGILGEMGYQDLTT